MSLISNLIARLSLDSRDFESGSSRARNSMRGLMAQSLSLQKGLVSLAGTYLGARGIIAGIRSVTSAAMDQQAAERSLAASLTLTGDATKSNMEAIKQYAAQIQKVTVYGDEEIINQIAYAKSMGLSTDRIGEATVAAIGLAAAYNKDLGSAMKYITLASKGETGQLKEMGIVIDKNLSPSEKYAELLRQMTEKFSLATEATKSAAGASIQLANTWTDTKKILGEALLPTVQSFFENLNTWLSNNQGAIKRWASDFSEGCDVVAEWMKKLESPTVALQTAFDKLGPASQKSIQKAYEDATGKSFGYRDVPVYGAYGYPTGFTRRRFFPPENTDYANKLIDAYRRSVERGPLPKANIPAAAGGTQAGDIPNLDVTSANPTPIGGAADAEKTATDIAAAYRRMYNDIDRMTEESYRIRRELLDGEYEEYKKVIKDKAILDQWYAEQQKKMQIEWAKSSDDFFAGWKAGFEEMKRDLQTLGGLGADEAKAFRDGVVDSLTDAVFESKNLGESLREVGREMAKMAFRWAMNTMVTSSLNSVFNVAHTGGIIGQTAFPSRVVGTDGYAALPRFHSGLRSDEFPAVLQRGEKVSSKAQVAGDNRLMGEMVGLLRKLVDKPSANVAVVRSREEVYEAMRHRDGQRLLSELTARNS